MQLKQLKYYIEKYEKYLHSRHHDTFLHIWESQRIFQEEWDIDATRLGGYVR